MTTDSTDEFLQHVFSGSSEAMRSFRVDIERLNRYCQRHKGAIRSILLTGETGVGKTRTAHIISAHSQWLTLTEEEKHNFFYDSNRNLRFPADQLVELLLRKSTCRGVMRDPDMCDGSRRSWLPSCLMSWPQANCSATRNTLSPALQRSIRVSLVTKQSMMFCWMKLQTCLPVFKRNCSNSLKQERSAQLEEWWRTKELLTIGSF